MRVNHQMTPQELEELLTPEKKEEQATVRPTGLAYAREYQQRPFTGINRSSEFRRLLRNEEEDVDSFASTELFTNVQELTRIIVADVALGRRYDSTALSRIDGVIERVLTSRLSETFSNVEVEIRTDASAIQYNLRITLSWFGRTKLLKFPIVISRY